MRKILSCALGAIILLGSAGLAACGEKVPRARYTLHGEYFPEERKLCAEMTVVVPNGTDTALDSLSFSLWPNAYREGATYAPVSELYASAAYYAGKSYGGILVQSVTGGAGYEVCGEDENILSVTLEKPLYPDECVELNIGFEVTLAQINHRLGVGEHAVNLANFYPVLCARGENGFLEYVYSCNGDPFVSDCADYEVTLTFPEEYTAAFNGAGEVTAADGKKTAHVQAENVRDVAFVLGKDFQTLTGDVNGVPVEYCYFADESPETALKVAQQSIDYFGRTFGKYSYPRYVVVETDFPFGGMEYSGLAMISSALRSEDVPAVVAHETAHQWWYAMVGSNQFENAWQDEGLAEYSSALFLGAHPEYGETYEEFVHRSESGYRAFFSVRAQVSGEADTGMNRPLTAFTGEYEYRNIAYDKGVIMFDRLRSVMGDRRFFGGLREYFEDYSGKIASPDELASCFGGAHVEELIRSFTDGKCVI